MNRPAWANGPASTLRRARPHCPNCNDMVIAPALSVHVHPDDIRHWWSCEACGYEFMTAVTVSNMRAEQYQAQVA
jgi:transcription elongation factor Elf1